MVTLTASTQTRPVYVAGQPGKHWPELLPSGTLDRLVPEVDPEKEQPNAPSRAHVSGNSRQRSSLIGKLAKPLLIFQHLLVGPPSSDRDRFNAAVAEARTSKYQGLASSWGQPH